jgi:hypothetical protein
VGAVAAWEVARLARNGLGWQQPVEMCLVVDTHLIDQEASLTLRGRATIGCCWG